MPNYRVRYKNKDVEFEIESSEEQFVELKLKDFFAQLQPAIASQSIGAKSPRARGRKDAGMPARTPEDKESVDLIGLVNRIKEASNYDEIERVVLKGSGQLARILLCLYFADQASAIGLTTGEVELITNNLGARVSSSNAANTLRNHGKYVSQDQARKKGAIIRYRVNLKGKDYFNDLMKPKTPAD